MTLSLVFWVLMLLWLVLGAWTAFQGGRAGLAARAPDALMFLLLLVLGWATFGAPVQT